MKILLVHKLPFFWKSRHTVVSCAAQENREGRNGVSILTVTFMYSYIAPLCLIRMTPNVHWRCSPLSCRGGHNSNMKKISLSVPASKLSKNFLLWGLLGLCNIDCSVMTLKLWKHVQEVFSHTNTGHSTGSTKHHKHISYNVYSNTLWYVDLLGREITHIPAGNYKIWYMCN